MVKNLLNSYNLEKIPNATSGKEKRVVKKVIKILDPQ